MDINLKIKRILAILFDLFLILLVYEVVGKCLIIIFNLSEIGVIICNIVGVLLIMITIINKDCLFKSGSLGKKIFGLAIYNDKTYEYVNNRIKRARNSEIIMDSNVVVDIIKINKHSGDIKYNTRVDYIKHYKN